MFFGFQLRRGKSDVASEILNEELLYDERDRERFEIRQQVIRDIQNDQENTKTRYDLLRKPFPM